MAWQDDMLVITRGRINEHYDAIRAVLTKLDKSGYKNSWKNSKLFQKSVEWCGFTISEEGVTPKASRVEAIQKIQPLKTLTEVRSYLGSVHYLMRYIPNLTTKTEPLQALLQKKTKWNCTETENNGFENLKSEIQSIVPLKNYDAAQLANLTTDASTKGLGATLWQNEKIGIDLKGEPKDARRPVAFASRFLNASEQNYAPNELSYWQWTGEWNILSTI